MADSTLTASMAIELAKLPIWSSAIGERSQAERPAMGGNLAHYCKTDKSSCANCLFEWDCSSG